MTAVQTLSMMHSEALAESSTSVTRSETCRKCGLSKKSGKLSCCVRGGAWFKRCGDPDDETVDHTWAEGFQACKGKFTRVCVLCCVHFTVSLGHRANCYFARVPCFSLDSVDMRAQKWTRSRAQESQLVVLR